MPMQGAENELVTTYKLDMESSNCGCPLCCQGDQPTFMKPPIPPPLIEQLQIDQDLDKFFDEANRIFHETGMPMIPIIFCHFCLPFSPVCCIFGCAAVRKRRLKNWLDAWNNEYGLPKGLYLTFNDDYIQLFTHSNSTDESGHRKPGVDLFLNRGKHERFCYEQGRAAPWPVTNQRLQHQPVYVPPAQLQHPVDVPLNAPVAYLPSAPDRDFAVAPPPYEECVKAMP